MAKVRIEFKIEIVFRIAHNECWIFPNLLVVLQHSFHSHAYIGSGMHTVHTSTFKSGNWLFEMAIKCDWRLLARSIDLNMQMLPQSCCRPVHCHFHGALSSNFGIFMPWFRFAIRLWHVVSNKIKQFMKRESNA